MGSGPRWAARNRGTPVLVASDFWAKVDQTGECWLWLPKWRDNWGCGYLRWNGRQVRAPRLAWELTYGPIPPGMFVCHHCDNPPCVRPDHLFLGSNADNVADMVRKGRHARGATSGARLHPDRIRRGEQNGTAKLTAVAVREIRSRYAAGEIRADLARAYGVSHNTIVRVVTGQHWKHLCGTEGV